MTGYESKKAAARDKLLDDDDTQVYQDHPAQEPLATLFGTLPVYDTTPPQRPWVGLTDADWKEIEDMPDTFDQGVAWCLATLKRKNT
jgi:hypothetical protein